MRAPLTHRCVEAVTVGPPRRGARHALPLSISVIAALVGAGCGASSRKPGLSVDSGGTAPDARADGTGNLEAGADSNPSLDGRNGDAAPADDARADGMKGDAADAEGGATPVSACTPAIAAAVPPAPLRPLSSFEYKNTVRDLLGLRLPDGYLPAGSDHTSPDDPAFIAVTAAHHAMAHSFAANAATNPALLPKIPPCDPGMLGETVCAQRFVAAFVPAVFRRPLAPEDADDFAGVFAKGRALGGDFASGIRAVVEVALQSPELLYRVEFGEAVDPAQPGLGRPAPYEMASRLSYLLLGSPPDDELMAAAARKELQTSDQIATQARRLLGDGRAHDVTRNFYGELLRLDDLVNRPPLSSNDLVRLAGEETARLVDDVVWTEGGDLKTLLTAPFTFVEGTLAGLYGIPDIDRVPGLAFRKASLPAGQRLGVLTQASVLASTSATTTYVSDRGALVFQQLLCGDLPAMPDPAAHVQPPMAAGETTRQWLARVTAADSCRSCHQQIDPLGFAFAHYDPAGAWLDDGSIDAHGELAGVDAAGKVDGALELAARLAQSRDVHACHVRKWMEAAYGRPVVGSADACSREQLEQAFAKTGGNIRQLMIDLTQTKAFLYRPAP